MRQVPALHLSQPQRESSLAIPGGSINLRCVLVFVALYFATHYTLSPAVLAADTTRTATADSTLSDSSAHNREHPNVTIAGVSFRSVQVDAVTGIFNGSLSASVDLDVLHDNVVGSGARLGVEKISSLTIHGDDRGPGLLYNAFGRFTVSPTRVVRFDIVGGISYSRTKVPYTDTFENYWMTSIELDLRIMIFPPIFGLLARIGTHNEIDGSYKVQTYGLGLTLGWGP